MKFDPLDKDLSLRVMEWGDGWTRRRRDFPICEFIGHQPREPLLKSKARQSKTSRPRSTRMWSAIHIALLCVIVFVSERKRGSGPKGNEAL